MITCPRCGKEHEDEVTICSCGQLLLDAHHIVATRALDDADLDDPSSAFGSAQFSMRTRLVLAIESDERSLEYVASEVEQLVMGRTDPRSGYLPDIKLDDYDAHEKGVSRKHAAIVRADRSLRLIDLHSANGTYLNGLRLQPDKPRVLRDGDEIRLGHLLIKVRFESITHS